MTTSDERFSIGKMVASLSNFQSCLVYLTVLVLSLGVHKNAVADTRGLNGDRGAVKTLSERRLEHRKGRGDAKKNTAADVATDATGDMTRLSPLPLQTRLQANMGLTLGVVGRTEKRRKGWPSGLWNETKMHVGIHGDVILARRSAWDFGVGPFVEVLTSLDDISMGGGVTVHVPVHDFLPIMVSAGGYGRYRKAWNGGVSSQVFWGSRSFNRNHSYVMAMGLVLQGRLEIVGEQKERTMVIALQIDGQVMALPVIMLYEAINAK